MAQKAEDDDKVRLDKWLWAARFYKTRALAKAAIAGGKVMVGGQGAKPSRMVRIGDALVVRRGEDVFEVSVLGLSEQRGPARAAQAVSSSDWRLSISVRWPNHEVKGNTRNELPNEKTTTENPMSRATRPRTFGIMRSDRGVGRVRSETAVNFARAFFPAPFFVVFFTRPGGRGILEVLFPRTIPTFCPFWRSEWDHPRNGELTTGSGKRGECRPTAECRSFAQLFFNAQ